MIKSSLSLLLDKPLTYVLYFSLRMNRVHKLYKFTSKESCCSGLPGEVISPHREKNKTGKLKQQFVTRTRSNLKINSPINNNNILF